MAVNADDMAEMVERLLDVSRLSVGRVQVELRHLPLRPAVDESLLRLGDRMAGRRVSVDVPSGLAVVADHEGLGHVLRNLLSNAAKFTEDGAAIRITARPDEDDVRTEVTDEGVGIVPGDVPRLFDRFFQGSSQPAGARGTGVGLSIVKRYVELMDGRIEVTSEPGRGSTFAITLARAPTSDAAEQGDGTG